jgi:tripartite-type tricarboxylate transporter receptor subunit TctC
VPADIVDKLNREINTALADAALKARIADMGGTALALSPSEFRKFIGDETDKWAKVIRIADIKAD